MGFLVGFWWGLKIHKEAENDVREFEPDSPEYAEQSQQIFSSINESHANGKVFEIDKTEFNGDPLRGKEKFEEIANSVNTRLNNLVKD